MTKTLAAGRRPAVVAAIALVLTTCGSNVVAQDKSAGASFVEEFDRLDSSFWYVSDGWSNGAHQNCTWSKKQVRVDGGKVHLGFEAGLFLSEGLGFPVVVPEAGLEGKIGEL